jgi:hypothetical protein
MSPSKKNYILGAYLKEGIGNKITSSIIFRCLKKKKDKNLP